MGALTVFKPGEVEAPAGLSGYARHAWDSVVASMDGGRFLTPADVMALEAGCRAWARWRGIEEKLAELSAGNALAGEVSKGADGRAEISAMRRAADSALAEYRGVMKMFGVAMPDPDGAMPEVDLFGYPVREGKGKAGRPRYEPSQRDRDMVCMLLALGWSNERIAGTVQVSLPTFRRAFKAELKERDRMRDRMEARCLEVAMQAVNAGNVSALKAVDRMVERNDLRLAAKRLREAPEQAEPEKPMPKSKKELLRHRAQTALMHPDLKPGLH